MQKKVIEKINNLKGINKMNKKILWLGLAAISIIIFITSCFSPMLPAISCHSWENRYFNPRVIPCSDICNCQRIPSWPLYGNLPSYSGKRRDYLFYYYWNLSFSRFLHRSARSFWRNNSSWGLWFTSWYLHRWG